MTKGKLLIITGLPAAGKDSVIGEFLKRNPNFRPIITHTSRPKRRGEIHGVHYHFVSKFKFEKLITENHFLEHVKTGLYYKGTSLSEFKNVLDGSNLIWEIELTRFTTYEETILKNFDEKSANAIINRSVKILLKPENKSVALKRYIDRDKKSRLEDFHLRWNFETGYYKLHRHKIPYVIINKTGKILTAVEKIERIISF